MTNNQIISPYLQEWDKRVGRKTAVELIQILWTEYDKAKIPLDHLELTPIDTYNFNLQTKNCTLEEQALIIKIFHEVLKKHDWNKQ